MAKEQLGPAAGPLVGAEDVFVRRSSGLVRTAGTYDVFIFNIGLISVGIAVALDQLIGPSSYPGSNIGLSTLIATLGMLAVGAAYYLWAVIFPRSGGNYVYQSRGLSPAVAFATTFMESVILMFYAALAASLMATVGFSTGLGVVGLITHNSALSSAGAWCGSPTGVFVIGAAFVVLSGLLPVFGMRRYFVVQRVMFVLAIVGTLLSLIVLGLGSRSAFTANLSSLTGLSYSHVIHVAQGKGWSFHGYTGGATIAFLVWPLLALLGGVQSIGIGGEIKKVSRSQILGMLGSIAGAGVVLVLIAVLADKAFGYDFQGAVAFNATAAPAASTPVVPYFTLLAGILTKNSVLAVLIVLGFASWIYFWIPAELIYAQRTMLAWSFDRLAPESVSYVHPRFHTPLVTIAMTTVAAVGFMALIAFTSYATLTLILGILVCWGISMVAGIFFPWTRKELYQKSPVARYRIGPVPVMSVVAAVAAGFMGWAFWLLWNDPIAAGHSFRSLASNIGLLVLGFIIYFVMRAVRRRQGVRLELAFKQLPIE